MKINQILIIISCVLISSCASAPTPQNPSEFRAVIKQGVFGSKFTSYEVDKSYEKSSKVLKSKAEECFKVSLVETSCINNSCSSYNVYYRPTVSVKNGRTELYVQYKRDPDNSIYLGGKPPKSGMYIAVIDVYPAGKNKTKVDTYGGSFSFDLIPTAVEHWIKGTNMGCPDFSQGT